MGAEEPCSPDERGGRPGRLCGRVTRG